MEPIPDSPGSNEPEAADRARRPDDALGRLACWIFAALALLLLLLWARRPEPAWLAASAIAVVGAAWLARPRTDRPANRLLLVGLATLAVAIVAGVAAQSRLTRIETDWPAEQSRRTRQLADRIGTEVERLAGRGRDAAARVAVAAETDTALVTVLPEILEQTGVDAAMVFTPEGDLLTWGGEHRGQIPRPVRTGESVVYFEAQPLYSYLYFTTAVKGTGLHAVAAVLLESAAPRPGIEGTVSFFARTDIPARFRSGAGSGEDVAWNLVEGGDTVVHALTDPPTQGTALQADASRAARVIFGLVSLGFLILLMGWLRDYPGAGAVFRSGPLLLAAVGLALAPLGLILGSPRAFSIEFLPPGPRPVPLGVLFAVSLPLTALAATWLRRPQGERDREAGLTVAMAVAALIAILIVTLRVLEYSTAASLLRGGQTLWFGLQTMVVLLLTAVAALLLPGPVLWSAHAPPVPRKAWLAFFAALATAATLGIVAHTRLEMAHNFVPTGAVFWAVPFTLLALAFRDPRVGRSGLTRWLAAGFLMASAVLPQMWGGHTGARLQTGEEDLASLGSTTPPILDFMLLELGRLAQTRFEAGESGAQLMYRSWVSSGLSREPYPVRVTLWSADGEVVNDLSLGGATGTTEVDQVLWEHMQVTDTATAGSEDPRVGGLTGIRNVRRFMTVPLDSLFVLTATVEPRRELHSEGILTPFLGGPTVSGDRLNFVRPRSGELYDDEVSWSRLERGWRAEALIEYPEGPLHAHLTLRVTPFWMRVARAALIVAFDLTVLALLWLCGHLAQGMRILPGGGIPWVHTFRARVTLALFIFFIVPTAVLGWIAYRGLSSVVTQAATDAASRAAEQAVSEWPQAGGDLNELSVHANADVLYFYRGELAEASSRAALELGIHNAWMLPGTYRLLYSGEESSATETGRIGDQDYITAYHNLQPTGALAVPVGEAAGVAARKQRDIAHLVFLAVVLGAMLSLLLSFLVGRTLAGPIGLLQRAAGAVGSGRLSVELPEPRSDEFGQLFSSFDEMVRQLRHARAREVRTARVLAWGEMARQVAHEIKNPLTPIRLAVQHLRRAFRDGRGDFSEVLDENVEQVLTEIDRLNDISRAFSRYGAPQEKVGPVGPVDVAEVVRETLTLYRAGESAIEYVVELDSPLPPVFARADELREVLLNLLENARDAVGDVGRVTVAGHVADGFVQVQVRDSGPGIAEDLMPHIFEPHFSTRSSGTGLGLAIVQRLVEGWGGTVSASSGPGAGTELRFRIPVAEEETEEAALRAADPPTLGADRASQ